jgi:hypothetical protein
MRKNRSQNSEFRIKGRGQKSGAEIKEKRKSVNVASALYSEF